MYTWCVRPGIGSNGGYGAGVFTFYCCHVDCTFCCCWCIWPNVVFIDLVNCLWTRSAVILGHDENFPCWIPFSQVGNTGLKNDAWQYFNNYGLLWSINAFTVLTYILSISSVIWVNSNFCVCIAGDYSTHLKASSSNRKFKMCGIIESYHW